MKKYCFLLAAAVLLILSVTLTAAAGTEETAPAIPSLFHNDEAWYKDGAAPLVCLEDVYYAPAELFGLFENISVTEPTDNNLLICSTADERYISILLTERRAAVNGTIVEDINVFRDGSVTYVDAVQVADTVGITAETITHEDGSVSMRLSDGTELLTTEELLAPYLPEEPEEDEFAGLEEEKNLDLKRIFILCREPDPEAEKRALDMLREYDMGYTLFLSGDTSTESLLHALAGGEYGILIDTAANGEEAVAELNAINERFGKITRYRTHFTMTTGSADADGKLIEAAYCPVTPDFVVDSSADADTMFADMLQYLGENNYCFLLLEDCPQTEQMLKLMSKIDREKFITSNLGH